MTHRRIGQDDEAAGAAAPRLWAYLATHADRLRAATVVDLSRPAPVRDLRGRAVQLRALQGGDRRACTRCRASVRSGRSRAGRSCSTTPAISSPAARPNTRPLVAVDPRRRGGPGIARAASFPRREAADHQGVLQRLDLAAIADRADRPALLDRAEAERARLLGADARPTEPFDWPELMESLAHRGDEGPATVGGRMTTRPPLPRPPRDGPRGFGERSRPSPR